MFANMFPKFDAKIVLTTLIACLLVIVGGALAQAALAPDTVPCAFAAGEDCGEKITKWDPQDVAIVGDSVSYTSTFLLLKPEGCNNDNLSTIPGAFEGYIVLLALDHDACTPLKTVTLINNGSSVVNGFSLSGGQNFTLDSIYDSIMLMKRLGSDFWVEVSRANNSPAAGSGVKAYHNANQSVNNNTWTVVAFNNELYDDVAMHDNSTNNSRLVAKVTGRYIATCTLLWDSNTTGARWIAIAVNGNVGIAHSSEMVIPAATTSTWTSVIWIGQLNVNDYVQCGGYQNSGGTRTLTAAGASPNNSPNFVLQALGN